MTSLEETVGHTLFFRMLYTASATGLLLFMLDYIQVCVMRDV